MIMESKMYQDSLKNFQNNDITNEVRSEKGHFILIIFMGRGCKIYCEAMWQLGGLVLRIVSCE